VVHVVHHLSNRSHPLGEGEINLRDGPILLLNLSLISPAPTSWWTGGRAITDEDSLCCLFSC
jgi:hypothetical protein